MNNNIINPSEISNSIVVHKVLYIFEKVSFSILVSRLNSVEIPVFIEVPNLTMFVVIT